MTNFSPIVALIPLMLLVAPTNGQQQWTTTEQFSTQSTTDNPYQYQYYDPYLNSQNFHDPASAAAAFKEMNPNNATSITLLEFMMIDPVFAAIYRAHKAQFALFDTNNDSQIEVSEQEAYIQKLVDEQKQAQIQQFNMTLKEYDRGDDKLEAPEFANYLESYCMKPKENVTVVQVMEPFDLDHDGALNPTEFYNFTRNVPENQLESCESWMNPATPNWNSATNSDTLSTTESTTTEAFYAEATTTEGSTTEATTKRPRRG